ncbi:MAG TPA: hypothetical protein VNM67_19715 [Thermoanaerobaculia bacterium]|nr:hypothetical protein [Thermoanaerobaculia bacterium]
MTPNQPPPRRYWLRMSVLLVLAMALLTFGTRAVSAIVARLTLPTGGAQWIWVERERTDRSPAAFYAVRDFFLDAVPPEARLLATADPEYVLTLNGKRIGAGQYVPPVAKLDAYEVGDLLQVGGNRLIVELRSDRGAGGFLASIQDGDGKTLVRTDGDWRIFKRHHFGLLRGWLPLGPSGGLESEPAFSWGLPPIGRWGRPEAGPLRPRLSELIHGQPVSGTRLAAPPIPALPPTSARRMALFDWGREVTGYLVLQMPPEDGLRTALFFTGIRVPDPLRERPAGAVLAMTGRRSWMDVRPRRFRYALVIGDRPLAARVLQVDPARAAGYLEDGVPKMKGVFGIEPPPLRTPVQDEIWRELQRVPGVRGRKER